MDIIYNDGHRSGAYLNKAQTLPDVVTKITNGLKATTNIQYQPITNPAVYTKNNTAQFPNQDFIGPFYVVSQTSEPTYSNDLQYININDGQHITTYHYTGAVMNKQGLGFLGFQKQTTTDQTTGITVSNTYSQNTQNHTKGMPLQSQTHLKDGTLIAEIDNTYALKTFNSAGLVSDVVSSSITPSPFLRGSTPKGGGG